MKRIIPLLVLLILIIIKNSPIYAYGVGFYTTGNVGQATTKAHNTYFGVDDDNIETLMYGIGCGLVYDSAVARNKLFNYRLNTGYENSVYSGSPFFTLRSMHKITLGNTFGFALYKNRHVRLWAGPQVELACQFGQRTWTRYVVTAPLIGLKEDSYKYYSYRKVTRNCKFVSEHIGFGGIFGINIHTGDLVSLSLEGGVSATVFIVQSKRHEMALYWDSELGIGMLAYPGFPITKSKNFVGLKINGFAKASIIFRVGDTYTAETPNITDEKVRLN